MFANRRSLRARRPVVSREVGPLRLEVEGLDLPVVVRRHARARRLTLRLARDGKALTVTAPAGVTAADVERFVDANRGWIAKRRAKLPEAVPFLPGSLLPIRGQETEIRHRPGRPTAARIEDGRLVVGGEPGHLERRVRDFLVAEARAELSHRALGFAAELDVRPAGVVVRDSVSRWGSCSSTRRLNFSWRLILAPEHVIDYVAAHEVAHLVEMNHGPRFWALVDRLTPHRREACRWLATHGPALHRYGATAG